MSNLLWDSPHLFQMIKRQGTVSKDPFFLKRAKVKSIHMSDCVGLELFLFGIWNMSLTDFFCKWNVDHKMYRKFAENTQMLNRQELIYSLFNFNRVVQSALATDMDGPAQFMLAHSKWNLTYHYIMDQAIKGTLFNKYLPSQGRGYTVKGKMTRRTLRPEYFRQDERGRQIKTTLAPKEYYVIDTVSRDGRLLYVIDEWSDDSKTGVAFVDSHFVQPNSFRSLDAHEHY